MAKKKQITAVQALRWLRDDIKELDWEKLGNDNRSVLIAKADVLSLIGDWLEYCLNPEDF